MEIAGVVWLNRQQMASLFDRDVKTIGKHVKNAIEEELEGISGLSQKYGAALIILNLQVNSNLLKFKYEQRRKR